MIFLFFIIYIYIYIPPEIWEARNFNPTLLRLCNTVNKQKIIGKSTKGCIFPFPYKGDHGITKNYRGKTLSATATNIYNALLLHKPEIEKIIRKNQNSFQRN